MQDAMVPEARIAQAASRGKFAFGLTPRALWLLLSGAFFLFPAFFLRSFIWGTAAWDAAVLLLIMVDGLQLPSPFLLRVERTWLSVLSQGVATEVQIGLQHEGRFLLHCEVTDDLSPALSSQAPWMRLEAYPHIDSHRRYFFPPKERGDHLAGKVFVRYRSSIGLVERWAVADLSQKVRVYPHRRPTDESQLYLARMKQIELQLRRQRLRGLGRDFESLRDYREGDDLRDVCWTATARRGTVVTKQYQVEKSQPVWLVIDAGRLLQAEAGIGTKLDYAAASALALAQLALAGGDRVGLLAYGRQVQQRVGLGRGSSHLRLLMESISQVTSEPSEADHLRATLTLNRLQPRRSLVLWITDIPETAMRPEVIDGASQLMRRHLLLFVVMRQNEISAMAALRPVDAEQMYRRAAAQDLLHRREMLLARLRERGALTMETTPQDMTAAVLNRYLDVKERGLL